MSNMQTLSIVVPCFNEEDTIEETHRRLVAMADSLDMDCEFLYVDDGSQDRTSDLLRRLAAGDDRVRFVRFARNFGHQVAVTAGMDESRGDAVVLIDADLQDPPELIPKMVELWRQGYEVVYGVRTARSGETRFKRFTAAAFYRLINRLSEVPIPLDTGDFRLVDAKVVHVLRDMPERSRFVRGLVSWVGFRQIPLPYEREARFAGRSNYPVGKMVRFALDGLTAFSTAPLRLASWLGLFTSALAMVGIVYAVAIRLFTDSAVPGWAGTIAAILFMGGVQLISIGAIGEYVGRIFLESKMRPLYVVAEASSPATQRDEGRLRRRVRSRSPLDGADESVSPAVPTAQSGK